MIFYLLAKLLLGMLPLSLYPPHSTHVYYDKAVDLTTNLDLDEKVSFIFFYYGKVRMFILHFVIIQMI